MEEDVRFTICRLCLNGNINLINVFDSNGILEYKPADDITELLQHEVSADDKFPQCICTECMRKLEEFKRFKQKCDYCRELLEKAYAVKSISSGTIGRSEDLTQYDNSHSSGVNFCDVKEPVCSLEEDPLAETDAEGHYEGEEAQLQTMEFITMGPHSVKPKIEPDGDDSWDIAPAAADSLNTHEMLHYSGNMNVIESGCDPSYDDPLADSEVEMSEIEETKPVIVTASYAVDEDVSSELIRKTHGDVQGVQEYTKKVKTQGREKFTCPKCRKEFVSSAGYRQHVQGHKCSLHFKCDSCGKGFANKTYLSKHVATHNVKDVKCNICERYYRDKTALRKHMVVHSEKRFHCDDCTKCFITKSELKRHKTTHRKEKILPCDICGKMFHNRDVLRYHKFTHKGGRPKVHKCSECEGLVLSPSKLREHMTTHTGEKPFSCMECSMRFSVKCSLVRHMVMHKIAS